MRERVAEEEEEEEERCREMGLFVVRRRQWNKAAGSSNKKWKGKWKKQEEEK